MKNYDKNMTKFATDVDCKDVEFTGIEILGAESKFWIEVGGKNYLYKIDDKMNFGFREVLVSFLCDSLGVDCVNAYPAFGKNTNQTGTIVENYIKDKTCTRVSLENLIVSYSDYYIKPIFVFIPNKFRSITFRNNTNGDFIINNFSVFLV